MTTKYIFVTGGVVSSLGKGIVAASLGNLLRARGYSVTIQKFDPYINVDPGTMSPFQHGEVFVTDDGAETDLDLGHYERFTNTNLEKINNVTAGSIYLSVITKERKGDYLGATVQTIPHITNEIKSRLKEAAKHKPDFLIAEIGGTVGDIEGLPFLEAIRQFKTEAGHGNTVFIHVTLVPYLNVSGELKTKPSQHSVITLRSIGIQPDILVCRTQRPIPKSERKKLALFTSVPVEAVIECKDLKSIYEVPIALAEEGLDKEVLKILHIENTEPELEPWKELLTKIKNPTRTVKIAIAGKYTKLSDAYISVVEALKHAGAAVGASIELKWISSEDCVDYKKAKEALCDVDGIVVPGGFGIRGIEGKVNVIRVARESNIPFLGLCLGMQCAVIEFARNVAGLKEANSSEFAPENSQPVIDLMPDQEGFTDYGGTMRLGSYECHLLENSKTINAYGQDIIYERHRHRYEVNNEFRDILSNAGLVFSGLSPDKRLVEIIELPSHKWFVASQFHPEFKSRPQSPHPLFLGLLKAVIEDIKNDSKLTAATLKNN
ncbi:MAG: CTP synthase [Candidatus Melainabacteria bacterium GWF2_32_7]|nr:MAG: CTP synthase [Candidatus Melainabacteria bacterium GWF2_32_7]